jgi:hypothetical protein
VHLRMIVDEIVNRIAPRAAPAVLREQRINDRGRIEPGVLETDRTAIQEERPARIVGNDAVVREVPRERLGLSQHTRQCVRVRLGFRELAGVVLDLVLERHG